MTTLLAKDLRLSLDALRPWALLVVGCAIAGVLWLRIPHSLLPAPIERLTVGQLLAGLGSAVAMTGVAIGAWCSAAVVQGDRTHGADALSHAVPVRPARRLAAKIGAICLGLIIPALVAGALSTLGDVLDPPEMPREPALTPFGLGLAGSAVGAGFALAVAPWVRGSFSTVALGLLTGMLLVGVGALVGWTAFGFLTRDLVEAIRTRELATWVDVALWHAVESRRAPACTLAAIWALGVGGAGAWAIGTLQLAETRSRTWFAAASGVVVGLAVAGGVASLWIHPTIREAKAKSATYGTFLATQMDDATLATRVRELGATQDARRRFCSDRGRDRGLVSGAMRRIRELPPGSSGRELLLDAVRSLYEMSDPPCATHSLALAQRAADPQWIAMTLDATLQFPDSNEALEWLARIPEILEQRPSSGVDDWTEGLSLVAFAAVRNRRLAAWDLECLRELVAQGHPESERMERVIEVLSRRLEQTDEKAPTP